MIPFLLRSGAPAAILSCSGERASLRSPESSPPGSTVGGRIEGVDCEFQMKVYKCRKDGETFLLEGRVQNATRAMKAKLAELAHPA